MISLSFEFNYKLDNQKKIKEWLNLIAKEEGNDIEELNFLFVDDQKMLEYNKKYLQHDYFTDIITFNSSDNNKISGDIIISIERVIENSKKYNCEEEVELRRVMAHGLLHLLGYDDKDKLKEKEIREKENHYLKKY